jgi:hypothetical protein
MSDLLARITALNAETQAWIDEDPANRWAGIFHTDIPHWNESGIYTAEDFDAYLDAEHEREMRKQSYYYDDDEMNAADRNYYDYVEYKWSQGVWLENADAHVDAYQAALKKYGVEYIKMIPTHFEVMANNAGYLEY